MLRFCLFLLFTAIFPLSISSFSQENISKKIEICYFDEKPEKIIFEKKHSVSNKIEIKKIENNFNYLNNLKNIQIIKEKIEKNNYKIFWNKEEKNKIKNILDKIPAKYIKSLEKIKTTKNIKRRWLAWSKSIYLNFDLIDSDKEFERVFIHELWHIIDLWFLKSKEEKISTKFKDWTKDIFADDKSINFYSLCWKNENEQNWKCWDLDFASKYSQSDVFEDFAESFLLYIKNNKSFKIMAKESKIMEKKYNFFKSILWQTKTWTYENQESFERVWDLTMEF